MCGSKGGGDRGSGPPLKTHKNIGLTFLEICSGPSQKSQSYQARIQCWANIDPPAAFLWRAEDGLHLVLFLILFPLIKNVKKKIGRNGSPLAIFSGSAHAIAISSSNNKGADQTAGLGVCWSRTFKSSCRVM